MSELVGYYSGVLLREREGEGERGREKERPVSFNHLLSISVGAMQGEMRGHVQSMFLMLSSRGLFSIQTQPPSLSSLFLTLPSHPPIPLNLTLFLSLFPSPLYPSSLSLDAASGAK